MYVLPVISVFGYSDDHFPPPGIIHFSHAGMLGIGSISFGDDGPINCLDEIVTTS